MSTVYWGPGLEVTPKVLLFTVFFFSSFDQKDYRILVLQLGIEPRPTAVKAGILTTGLPGNSLLFILSLVVV